MKLKEYEGMETGTTGGPMAQEAAGEEKSIDKEALKKKYGKVYQISASFSEDDESEDEIKVSFVFKKPVTASLNRYLRTASKNMTGSTTAFLLDNIIPEQKKELEKKIGEYPALTIGIGQKLLNVLGLSDNINLTKL